MSDTLKLAAEARTEFGKGAARRARAAGKTPAVLYGHGEEPVHVLLPSHATMLALKVSNVLLNIDLGSESHLAIAKDIQRDPVKRTIDHVDLLIVKKGEKITVDVAVTIVGEPFPGTIYMVDNAVLQVLAEATNLPETLEVSVEGFNEGDRVLAGEVKLPNGAELVTDPEALVVSVSVPRAAASPEEAAAEAGEGEAAAPAEDA